MLVLWVPPWLTDRLRNSKPGECFWDPSLNKEFVFIVALLGHHVPFCIMISSYSYVFLFTRKRAKLIEAILSQTRPAEVNVAANSRSSKKDTSSVRQSNESGDLNVKQEIKCQPDHPQLYCQLEDDTNNPFAHPFICVQNADDIGDEKQICVSRFSRDRICRFSRDRVSRFSRDRKVFITLTYIIIGYAVLWLPFHIVFDIGIVSPGLVPEYMLNIFFWMTYFNSTINPILYNFSNSEFRKSFRNILQKCKCF